MSQRVLIIAPYRTVAPHFETELEIAQRHRDGGDQVILASCLGELPGCEFNPVAQPDTCQECKRRRQYGVSRIAGGCRSGPLPIASRGVLAIPERLLASPAALRAWRIGGFDIGYACLSSLVSLTRDPEPDLSKHRGQLARLAGAAYQTWQATQKLLALHQPDRVYVFNGRFAAMRAVLRACQQAKVDCFVHERGSDTGHFQLYRNHLPHDLKSVAWRMQRHWHAAAANPRRELDARAWFSGRVARVERNWRSFVTGQRRGELPSDWDASRHNIVVFTSSDDEFVAIGDCWENALYPDQPTAIARIASDLQRVRPDAHLTVRVHPNLRGIDNQRTRQLLNLAGKNVTIIPADAAVDSYQLMRLADTVVTFGSSMGIEAVYWARPSVLLGPCFYQSLRGPRQPKSHDETMRLLARDLVPAVAHDALLYGYWQQTHGIRFQHFQADDLFTGRFRGEVVWPRPPKTLSRYITRPIRSLRKRLPAPLRKRAA
jgi:hypothetical protein